MKLWGIYDNKKVGAQIAAEENHENEIANEPRDDDAFAKRVRGYEDHNL